VREVTGPLDCRFDRRLEDLNGLIVEHLQEIPEADVSIKINNVPMEIRSRAGRTDQNRAYFPAARDVENTETQRFRRGTQALQRRGP